MKFDSTIKNVSILFVIISLAYSTIFAKIMPTWPIEYSLETEDQLDVESIIHFSLNLTPKQVRCDEITVSVKTIGGLTYLGETNWTFPYRDKIETNYSFDIIIPDNDTSGLLITTSCGDYSNTINRYFVTTSDSVQMIRGIPMTYPEGFLRPKFEGRIGNVIPGEFPEDDSLYGIPENPYLIDHETEVYTQYTKSELERRDMRWLEHKPLTDKDKEYFYIDNKPYVRYRGEYKFTKVKTYTNAERHELYKMRMDSLRENPSDNDYDIIINLTNSDNYDFVSSFIDELIPTENKGFYRAIIKKNIVNKLLDNKIKHTRTNKPSWIKSDSTKEERRRQPESVKKKTD